jgi:predicted nucleic acid-binding protein
VNDRFLFDTDVLIDCLRGHTKAVEFINQFEGEVVISAITAAELWAGVKGNEETRVLHSILSPLEIIPVDSELARRGGLYRRQYGPSHSTGLSDAIVAATTERVGAKLITLNLKHYPMVKKKRAPYRK